MKHAEYRLKHQLHEVFFIEPNNLGINSLTRIYKTLTAPLKTMPLVIIIPLSVVAGVILFILLNRLIVKLVTLLQYGF